jgi:murein DD-endopeptidase MepM/ murein hydrolase activator NlpD
LVGTLLAGVLASCGTSDPGARAYLLPWSGGTSYQVMQGPLILDALGACTSACGSHRDEDGQHAWDFDLPDGTPVRAARAGTVGLVVGSWGADHCGGLSPVAEPPPGYLVNQLMGNQANLVRIDHGDGTSALYLHLSSVAPAIEARAKTGEPVAQGEVLGLSGKTGLTGCVPHLHFQVEQTVRADWYTTSLPISFSDPDVLAQDPDGVPAEGGTYVSGNAPGPP